MGATGVVTIRGNMTRTLIIYVNHDEPDAPEGMDDRFARRIGEIVYEALEYEPGLYRVDWYFEDEG